MSKFKGTLRRAFQAFTDPLSRKKGNDQSNTSDPHPDATNLNTTEPEKVSTQTVPPAREQSISKDDLTLQEKKTKGLSPDRFNTYHGSSSGKTERKPSIVGDNPIFPSLHERKLPDSVLNGLTAMMHEKDASSLTSETFYVEYSSPEQAEQAAKDLNENLPLYVKATDSPTIKQIKKMETGPSISWLWSRLNTALQEPQQEASSQHASSQKESGRQPSSPKPQPKRVEEMRAKALNASSRTSMNSSQEKELSSSQSSANISGYDGESSRSATPSPLPSPKSPRAARSTISPSSSPTLSRNTPPPALATDLVEGLVKLDKVLIDGTAASYEKTSKTFYLLYDTQAHAKQAGAFLKELSFSVHKTDSAKRIRVAQTEKGAAIDELRDEVKEYLAYKQKQETIQQENRAVEEAFPLLFPGAIAVRKATKAEQKAPYSIKEAHTLCIEYENDLAALMAFCNTQTQLPSNIAMARPGNGSLLLIHSYGRSKEFAEQMEALFLAYQNKEKEPPLVHQAVCTGLVGVKATTLKAKEEEGKEEAALELTYKSPGAANTAESVLKKALLVPFEVKRPENARSSLIVSNQDMKAFLALKELTEKHLAEKREFGMTK